MLNFLFGCMMLALCLTIGGFVLNLVFMLFVAIICGLAAIFEWFTKLFRKET